MAKQTSPPDSPPAVPKWAVEAPGFPALTVEAATVGEAIRKYGEAMGVWHFAVAPVAAAVKE